MDEPNAMPSQHEIADWMSRCGLATKPSEVTEIVSIGDGNMNLVFRVTAGGRYIIVKRSVPYVAKYPQIAAPVQRIATEIAFYESVADHPDLAGSMPTLLGADAEGHTMLLEAIDHRGDWRKLYDPSHRESVEPIFGKAVSWLRRLHGIAAPPEIGCDPLRELNHSHWFELPLSQPPVIDLDAISPGLDRATETVRGDERLRRAIARIGRQYLHPASAAPRCLLHGDYFPGAWLDIGSDAVCVIDPEFAFVGPPEFDLGVLIAHHRFCGGDPVTVPRWLSAYSPSMPLDSVRIQTIAATETIRRLLGVAQLPLVADTEQRLHWIDEASALLLRFAD